MTAYEQLPQPRDGSESTVGYIYLSEWVYQRLIQINKLFYILACPIPEKATRGATGTKSGDFNQ